MTAGKIAKIFISFMIIGGIGSCVAVGELREESHSVELGEVESAEIQLKMNQGELRVRGGARGLMEVTFEYNVRRWKPDIDYSEFAGKARLTIHQGKKSGIPIGKSRNTWDITLNDTVPIALVVDFGAGEGNLDLRGFDLESLDIDMGVGDLTVDLSSPLDKDLEVTIDGGIGSATVYLPENIGVRVDVDKGIGSVEAQGLIKRRGFYTNEAFGSTEKTIDISIEAGIGSIDLILK